MILANLLALTVLSDQITTPAPTPIVILAQSDQFSEAPLTPKSKEVEQLLTKNQIQFYKYQSDLFDIYISKKIAPIESYKLSIEWLQNVAASKKTNFSLSTPEGQQLFDALCKRRFMGGIESAPEEEFMALVPAFVIKTEGNPVAAPLSPKSPIEKPVYQDPKENPASVQEQFRKASQKPSPLPAIGNDANYSVKDFGALARNPKHAQALQEVAKILGELGSELEQLKNEEAKARENLIRQLLHDEFGSEPFTVNGERNFNQLPTKMKEMLMQMAASNPQLFGFSNNQDATRYLESNPKLDISFNIAIQVRTKSTHDPNDKGGTTNIIILNG